MSTFLGIVRTTPAGERNPISIEEIERAVEDLPGWRAQWREGVTTPVFEVSYPRSNHVVSGLELREGALWARAYLYNGPVIRAMLSLAAALGGEVRDNLGGMYYLTDGDAGHADGFGAEWGFDKKEAASALPPAAGEIHAIAPRRRPWQQLLEFCCIGIGAVLFFLLCQWASKS